MTAINENLTNLFNSFPSNTTGLNIVFTYY